MNIPEGWQLVPKELTPAMLVAQVDQFEWNGRTGQERANAIWTAMLKAAPPAPAARQLHSFSSIDCEALIAAVLPGGSICDPQQVADSIRSYLNAWPPAPAAQASGWTDADADAARLALELECLLSDKDVPMPALSRWWDSAHEALKLHRERMAGITAPRGQEGEHG